MSSGICVLLSMSGWPHEPTLLRGYGPGIFNSGTEFRNP